MVSKKNGEATGCECITVYFEYAATYCTEIKIRV